MDRGIPKDNPIFQALNEANWVKSVIDSCTNIPQAVCSEEVIHSWYKKWYTNGEVELSLIHLEFDVLTRYLSDKIVDIVYKEAEDE